MTQVQCMFLESHKLNQLQTYYQVNNTNALFALVSSVASVGYNIV